MTTVSFFLYCNLCLHCFIYDLTLTGHRVKTKLFGDHWCKISNEVVKTLFNTTPALINTFYVVLCYLTLLMYQ